ncbi:MAG: PEP-CTERM sorting domain-containing protein [Armatimonadetes bacterium]|nr:PEP-CTERM sorting domain-containing protein [Armatimonadota bacterium]
MKKTVCLIALSFAGLSFGSFDLMYLPDVTYNKINRYDPVNRVYLGSFASPSAQYIAAHVNSPYITASETNRTTIHDAVSGDYVNGTVLTTDYGSMNAGGDVLGAVNSTLRVFSTPSGGVFQAGSSGFSTNIRGTAFVGSNYAALATDASGNIAINVVSPSFALLSSTVIVNVVATAGGLGALSGLAATTSTGGITNLWFTYRSNANVATLQRVTLTGTAVSGSIGLSMTGFSTASLTSSYAVMAGHGSAVYVVGPDATTLTTTRSQKFGAFGTVNALISDGTTNAFSVPTTGGWSGANVIAPEPSSLLGLGLAALLLRRRRRQVD